MANLKRKVVLVGAGMVGMSFAYAALNQSICDELILIDLNEVRARGEAMDLNHGLAFSNSSMQIKYGAYSDCSDADIVVICAGVNQKEGETRLQLLQRNYKVFESIVPRVVSSGFEGIFLVATNPVDIMTRITYELSGFNAAKVMGTGTTLDTARLRYLLGNYFEVDPRHMHAYVVGEHGDSEFVPWSQAMMSVKPVYDVIQSDMQRYKFEDLDEIADEVRNAAYQIIKAKGSTYYGIGMAICRIVRAIFHNENSVFTTAVRLRGEYGLKKEVFIGHPCIINSGGANRVLEMNMTNAEIELFKKSYEILDESFCSIEC